MYVKLKRLLYHILVLFVSVYFLGCATPIGPTGGPRDSTGPKVLSTEPETGTTNYDGRSISFQFDEFVNRNSVTSNITIEPDLGLRYSLDWRRKTLNVKFENELPDSTTIIVTLEPGVTDTRSNKIGSPIKVAFSTGDEIDEGRVLGRIRSAETGEGVEDATVLLYREPVNLNEAATYKAQTDTGGVFEFAYLREGRYQALYLDDRNRNKTWEAASENAQPFHDQFIRLEKAASDTLAPIYIVQRDTLAPELLGVGLLSSQRLRFRFDENIEVQDTASIVLQDTLGNLVSNAYPLYISKEDPFVLFVQSEEPTDPYHSYTVSVDGIFDAAGNRVITEGVLFSGSAQEDTTLQRILQNKSDPGLFPSQAFEVVYAAPITDPVITDSVVVAEGEVTFEEWPDISIRRNHLYIEPQEDTWIEGVSYQFLVWDPFTRTRKLYSPEVWDATELGEIEVRLEDGDSTKVYNMLLESDVTSFRLDTTFTESVTVSELAPVSYRVSVFEDRNNNGIWDEGSVVPFTAPEPYFVKSGIKIRTGFTSEVIITF